MPSVYWWAREKVRTSWLFDHMLSKLIFRGEVLVKSNRGSFAREVVKVAKERGRGKGVALCVRIRDEAPNLREFVEYYLAAGVSHLFFYEARSVDDFRAVLNPFITEGCVTLIDNWPHVPISPAAEHDCVLRCIGRYAWMGCIDADEFVVVRSNRHIDEFLDSLPSPYPALALFRYTFGSNGYKTRPAAPVIEAYPRRGVELDSHVKVFVRPERVSSLRNPHSWYYRGFFSTARDEYGRRVFASGSQAKTADKACIHHYHHKSEEEYLAKSSRPMIQDWAAIKMHNRSPKFSDFLEKLTNIVVDRSAVQYHAAICRRKSCCICTAAQEQKTLSDCGVSSK